MLCRGGVQHYLVLLDFNSKFPVLRLLQVTQKELFFIHHNHVLELCINIIKHMHSTSNKINEVIHW